jgi:large repetitive protein
MCRKLLIACVAFLFLHLVMPHTMAAANACTQPILTDLSYQAICQGAGFTPVTESVTNGVNVSFQWYNDNGDANPTTTALSGQASATLTVLPTAIGIYKYKIVATNTTDATCSASKTVTLVIAPLIPAREICGGETFTATAQSGLKNIQWSVDLGSGYTPISGATNASLTITSAGKYKYSAQDASGCVIDLCCPIEIKPCPACKEDIIKTDVITQIGSCNEDSLTVCLPIRFDESFNYNIYNGLQLYAAEREGCDFDTLFQYNYFVLPGQGASGPYRLDYWYANGKTFTIAKVNSMQQVVDSMNIWDPAGAWKLDIPTLSIVGGLKTNVYQDMRFTTLKTGAISIIRLNLNIVSKGTRLKFKVKNTPQTIVFENILTGCKDTVIINTLPDPNNDPPLAIFDGVSTLEDTPITVAVLLNDSDPDGAINPLSLEITKQPKNGVAKINADGTITYNPTQNFFGKDSLIYKICDKCSPAACDTAIVYFTVNSVNDAIIANVDAATTTKNTPVFIPIKTNDNDPDGNLMAATVTITNQPKNGIVSVETDGTLKYTPNANFFGLDSLVYRLCDDGAPQLCDTAIVFITVKNTNNLPIANREDVSTLKNTPILLGILANDTKGDGLPVGGLTIAKPTKNGTLTINTGNPTDPNDDAILYTPNTGFVGIDTLNYKICDIDGDCDTAIVTINIYEINDKPVANTEGVVTNEDTPIKINVLLNDNFGTNGASTNKMTIISVPKNGSVMVNEKGTATTTDDCLDYTPNLNYNGLDSLVYQICDADGDCDTAVVYITIQPVNDPPIANWNKDKTTENTPKSLTVLTNDSDTDGALVPSSVEVTTQPKHGTAIAKADGTILYTPSLNYAGNDTLIYKVCDNGTPLPAQCDTAIVFIEIEPNCVEDIIKTDVLTFAGKCNEDSLTVCLPIAYEQSFNYKIFDNNVLYTAEREACDFDTLFQYNYFVLPGRGATGPYRLDYWNIGSKTYKASSINSMQQLVDSMNVWDAAGQWVLNTNDLSIVGGVKTTPYADMKFTTLRTGAVSLIRLNLNIVGRGTRFRFKTGTHDLVLENSNTGCKDRVKIIATPDPNNKPPVASCDHYSVPENDKINIAVLLNDFDLDGDIDTSSLQISTQAKNGKATVKANGIIEYAPNLGFSGRDSFIYNVCDKCSPAACDTAIVFINVNRINKAPIANVDSEITAKNTPINIPVKKNDTDDGDIMTATVSVSTPPKNGTTTVLPNGIVQYTPNNNFTGKDSLIYTLCDAGTPSLCDTAIVFIEIEPSCVEDIIKTDALTSIGKCTDDSLTICLPLLYENNTLYKFYDNGMVYDGTREACDFDTLFQYNYFVLPNKGASGPYRLDYWNIGAKTYKASSITSMQQLVDSMNVWDAAGQWTLNTNDLSIVGGVKTTPYADMRFTTLRTGAVSLIRLNLNIVARGTRIMLKKGADHNLVIENINTGCKDRVSVKAPLDCGNTAPVANADYPDVPKNAPMDIPVLLNDKDTEQTLTASNVSIENPPKNGTAVINPDGTIKYTPNPNFTGKDTLIYKVCDNGTPALCDTALVVLTVSAINDSPIANRDDKTTGKNTPTTVFILENDEDTEGGINPTSVTISENPKNGTVLVNADGTLAYTPNTNFTGKDTLIYRVCDKGAPALCDTALVVITINAQNETPVALDDVIATDNNTPISETVASNDTDADTPKEELTYTLLENVPNTEGVLVLNPDGVYTFSPNPNFVGTVKIPYKVCDKTNLCDTATLTITVKKAACTDILADKVLTVNGVCTTDSADVCLAIPKDSINQYKLFVDKTPYQAGFPPCNYDTAFNYNYYVVRGRGFSGAYKVEWTVDGSTKTIASVADFKALVDSLNRLDVGGKWRLDIATYNLIGGISSHKYGTMKITQIKTRSVSLLNLNTRLNPKGTIIKVKTGVHDLVIDRNGCLDTTKISVICTPKDSILANRDDAQTLENQPVTISILTNDINATGLIDPNTITIVENPKNGTATRNAVGDIVYTPNQNFTGKDTLIYRICSNRTPSAKCDTALVVITVKAKKANPKPETKLVELDLGKKDTLCLSTQELTGKDFTIIMACTAGNDNVIFTPIPNSNCIVIDGKKVGQTDMCFAVCDEYRICDTTFIYAKVKEKKVKVTNDSVTIRVNTPVKIKVMENDSAAGAGTSAIVLVTNPNHGTAVVGSDGSINYIPNKDYCSSKPDSMRYVSCNSAGCDTAYVRVTILCEDVKFYSGFSPNGDGMNDVFVIEGLEKYPNNRLCIYNRWGNQILEVKAYKNDWDGKWNNKILPDGTYFYLFDKGDGSTQLYSGYVQIQR